MNVEELSSVVVDAAYHLHRDLGPGLLESVYETVLARMLEARGLRVERQKPVAFDVERLFWKSSLPDRGGSVVAGEAEVRQCMRRYSKETPTTPGATETREAVARISKTVSEGMHFDEGLRLDLLVNGCLVVELKSVEQFALVHAKQLLTYLRLLDLPLGLLINFGAPTFKEGIKRVVNNHQQIASSRLRVNQQPPF